MTLLLLAGVVALPAQQAVLQVFDSSNPDARLENILYLSIGVELSRDGFGSRRISLSDARSESEEARRLEEESRGDNAPGYILIVEYEPDGGDLDLKLTLYGADTGEPIQTAALRSPIDIDLDARVTRAVRTMLDAAALEPEVADASPDLEGVDLLPRQDPNGVSAVGRGLEVSTLVSGILVLGPATEFFRYGVSGSLIGSYSRPFAQPTMSLGGRAGFVYLFSDEGVEGGRLYVVNLGPEALLSTPFRNPARLGARVAAGASVLIVSRESDTLAKMLPHVEAGVAARLPLGSRFSLGIEVNYYVLFEPGFPVMGIVPSLTVSLEPPGE
jgi:hypothetical protein